MDKPTSTYIMPRVRLPVVVILALAAPGCRGGRTVAPADAPRSDISYSGDRATRVLDWGDMERHRGTIVTVEGRFNHIRGEHGIVTLDSGLDVYIPNVHLYLRGQPWFDYIGRRVVAIGLLRTEGCEIPGYWGPSLNSVNSFSVVQQ